MINRFFFFMTFIFFTTTASAQKISDQKIPATLRSIQDGDTVDVAFLKTQKNVFNFLCNHKRARVKSCKDNLSETISIRVRLFRTDSPEFGKKNNEINFDQTKLANLSKQKLISLTSKGKNILVKMGEDSVGPFGRLLAEIFLVDGTNINLEMVRAGWSIPYMFHPVDLITYKKYINASLDAILTEQGLFSKAYIQEEGNIPPHEYRLLSGSRASCYTKDFFEFPDRSVLKRFPNKPSGFYFDPSLNKLEKFKEAIGRVFYDRKSNICKF